MSGTQSMRVALIGCGLIGNKRAAALNGHCLVAAADVELHRAERLAARHAGCRAFADWRDAIMGEVDLVIVSTTNNMLAEITLAAVRSGKHVLVEKPGARHFAELEPVIAAATRAEVVVKVGFNHRFHPALLKAREIVNAGQLGRLMFIRARYGHGGRLGMEKEWRGNPALSGGGEMLDQGVHLIDLARWFLGDFAQVEGRVERFFWDWQVEDNGFAFLKNSGGQVAWLHASCTEWKNIFSFEIYGQTGKLHIEGLGGSYGIERLSFHQMLPEMGPPPTTIWEYPGEDLSWGREFDHFVDCIRGNQGPNGNLHDALAAMRIVQQLYDLSGDCNQKQ